MNQPAYCTILARNYLPAALTLSESLLRYGDGTPLTIFLIDATDETDLPETPGVRWMHPGMLDLPERTVLELAMDYDLVEFATAVKPLVLQVLLREHEHAAYLDPDTYVVSPMDELSPALEASHGIVLTPHYIDPPSDGSQFSEGHLLHVGFYNLGFCAVDRRAEDFLTWWWGHLSKECLHEPLAGLFVDQKWVDVGGGFFGATSLQHRGYNISIANLHERPIARDEDGYFIAGADDRLRLFHFHSFDPRRPDELTTRVALHDGRALQEGSRRSRTSTRTPCSRTSGRSVRSRTIATPSTRPGAGSPGGCAMRSGSPRRRSPAASRLPSWPPRPRTTSAGDGRRAAWRAGWCSPMSQRQCGWPCPRSTSG